MPDDANAPTPSAPVKLRPAATVMLVRDRPDGVEVFLMERSHVGQFGGLHVFPGGKVDSADHADGWAAYTQGLDDAAASQVLGLDRGGLGYWVACIRECFEEAGVLLATQRGGGLLPLQDPDRRTLFGGYRDRINGREAGAFEAMCEEQELLLAGGHLAYVSHWITPHSMPKRFDTRFFVAVAPAAQEALHDGVETVESAWIRPEVALTRFEQGDLNLISPTFKNLEAIAGFDSTEALLKAKRAIDPASIPAIRPKMVSSDSAAFDEVIEVIGKGGRFSDT